MREPDIDVPLADLLSLIGEEIPIGEIETWTASMKASAVTWASTTYLRANDNQTIRVPRRPSFLPEKVGE